jgi:hypothetical protein
VTTLPDRGVHTVGGIVGPCPAEFQLGLSRGGDRVLVVTAGPDGSSLRELSVVEGRPSRNAIPSPIPGLEIQSFGYDASGVIQVQGLVPGAAWRLGRSGWTPMDGSARPIDSVTLDTRSATLEGVPPDSAEGQAAAAAIAATSPDRPYGAVVRGGQVLVNFADRKAPAAVLLEVATGQVAWSSDGKAVLWPEDLPVPW